MTLTPASVIYKYPLDLRVPSTTVPFKSDSQVVHVGEQNGEVMVWIEHPTLPSSRDGETIEFYVFGTGHLIENRERLWFVGSAMVGPFVWHIFREKIND